MVAGAVRWFNTWAEDRDKRFTWIAPAFIGAAAISSIITFQYLNGILKFIHLGSTDTVAIYNALNNRRAETPIVIVSGDKTRFEQAYIHYTDLGRRAFGDEWERTKLYHPRSDFDRMHLLGPTNANFGRRYGEALCTAFRLENCPVIFQEQTP